MTVSKKFSVLLLAAAALLPCPARAQFLGYVSPQTVVQTLASNVSCTGSAQTFVVANLGQTQHNVTVSGNNARQLRAQIEGVDGAGNVTRISDVLDNAQLAPTPTTITGNGYFPIVRVNVTCSGASSNVSITYSGTSTPNPQPVGGYQISQIDKAMFLGVAANANATDNFQPPFGSTAGFINVIYQTAAGPSGSTVQLTCAGNLMTTYSTTFNLATTQSVVQTFQVAANPCTALTVQYFSGGASSANVSIEYIFYVPGTQTTLTTPNSGTSSAPPVQIISDSLAQAFSASASYVNPASGSQQLHINPNNGAKSVYFDKLIISCSVACVIDVQQTTTTGTSCGGQTIVNQKLGSSVTASATANICTGAASTPNTIINGLQLGAGVSITIDLRGFIAPAGTTNGILTSTHTSITGTENTSFFWYEK